MLKHIDHIGIAVHSIEEAAPLYRDVLGLEHLGDDVVEEQGVRVSFYKLGEAKIELLEPTREDSAVAKFLARKGPGVHHVAMRTEDIKGAAAHVADNGIRVLYPEPRDGAHGKLINFLHPKDTHGVMLELTQRRTDGD